MNGYPQVILKSEKDKRFDERLQVDIMSLPGQIEDTDQNIDLVSVKRSTILYEDNDFASEVITISSNHSSSGFLADENSATKQANEGKCENKAELYESTGDLLSNNVINTKITTDAVISCNDDNSKDNMKEYFGNSTSDDLGSKGDEFIAVDIDGNVFQETRTLSKDCYFQSHVSLKQDTDKHDTISVELANEPAIEENIDESFKKDENSVDKSANLFLAIGKKEAEDDGENADEIKEKVIDQKRTCSNTGHELNNSLLEHEDSVEIRNEWELCNATGKNVTAEQGRSDKYRNETIAIPDTIVIENGSRFFDDHDPAVENLEVSPTAYKPSLEIAEHTDLILNESRYSPDDDGTHAPLFALTDPANGTTAEEVIDDQDRTPGMDLVIESVIDTTNIANVIDMESSTAIDVVVSEMDEDMSTGNTDVEINNNLPQDPTAKDDLSTVMNPLTKSNNSSHQGFVADLNEESIEEIKIDIDEICRVGIVADSTRETNDEATGSLITTVTGHDTYSSTDHTK